MRKRDGKPPADALLKAVLQGMNEAAVLRSAEGRVVLWNRVAAEIFGYTAPDIIGENADILVPAGERQYWHELEKRVRGGAVVRRVRAVRLAKGERRVRVLLTLILVDKANPANSEILEMYDRYGRNVRVAPQTALES